MVKKSSSATTPGGSEGQTPPEPHFFVVGKIQRPHGVRGELKIEVLTHYPEWMHELDAVYLGKDAYDAKNAVEYPLEEVRYHRDNLLLRLGGIKDRNAAELLRDLLVMIRIDQAQPLGEDEFYVYEIIGMEVYTNTDEYLGIVKEIMETGANDVFIIEGGNRGTVLIPDTEEVVLDIDPDARKMTINPIPGLLSDAEVIEDDEDD